jgi:hypothetical protein
MPVASGYERRIELHYLLHLEWLVKARIQALVDKAQVSTSILKMQIGNYLKALAVVNALEQTSSEFSSIQKKLLAHINSWRTT